MHQNIHRASLTSHLLIVAFSISGIRLVSAHDHLPRNEQAIADVQAGRTETARASWWGFDPSDATNALQAALNCRAKHVLIENMGSPWIVTTIQLVSNKDVEFEPGTVIEAKRGAFLGRGDCLFTARGCEHLTLRSNSATLRMHKSDYHKPPYELAEWRHALSIGGCQDVLVDGLTLAESGGDGIYLGVGPHGETNRDVTIRNVVCDRNNRQGISVITAENLLIENSVFSNTRGTAPQAGIDFEPNRPSEPLVNCVLRNCRSENNAGHAYHNYFGHMNQESTPISIRYENCSSKNCQQYSTYLGIANRQGERTVRGSIEYVGCRFDADNGAAVYIRGNEAGGCLVRFQQCEIIRRDKEEAKLAPITIEAPRRLDLDVGNVNIVDCVIRDSIVRKPIALVASPMVRIRNIRGTLTVESPQGTKAVTLDTRQLDEWFPQHGRLAKIPRHAFNWRNATTIPSSGPAEENRDSFRVRRESSYLVSGRAGHPCTIVARVEPVGRHTPTAGTMTLTPCHGAPTTLHPTNEDEHLVYEFVPPETGTYRLDWQGDSTKTIRVVRCSEPIGMLGELPGIDLFRPTGKLCFSVPNSVERFAIQISGAGTAETVKASVRDAANRIVAQQDNIAAPHVFVLKRDPATSTEIWSVALEKASEGVLEDVSIQLVGVAPVFGSTPQDVFSQIAGDREQQ